MIIPEVIAANRYIANGSTLNFVYGFPISDSAEILVLQEDSILVYRTHFDLTGIGSTSGGIVQMYYFIPDGVHITILRASDIAQILSFPANSSYPPLNVEFAFNQATKVDQMLAERIDRAPKFFAKSTYRDLTIDDPVEDEFLRWRADKSGIESVGISTFGDTIAALSDTGVVFADGSTSLNTNSSKMTWDNTAFTLNLLDTARITMQGGVYTPTDGGAEFRVMTDGSSVTSGSSQGLRKATWQFFDTNLTNADNAVIKIDVLSTSYDGVFYGKTGLHVQQYSLPDIGGDTSGILSLQTGGGNAISAFRFTDLRPAGKTEYLTNGFALEVGHNTSSAAMLIQNGWQGNGINAQAIVVNMNSATAKGIVFQPVSPADFDGRIAMEIAQYTPGAVNTLPQWALSLGGVQVANSWAGGIVNSHYELGPQGVFFQRKTNDEGAYIFAFRKDRADGSLIDNDLPHSISIEGTTGGTNKVLGLWQSQLATADDGNEFLSQSFYCIQAGTLQPFMELASGADGDTTLLIRRNVGGSITLERVSMGIGDSGGAGYKLLRVPN